MHCSFTHQPVHCRILSGHTFPPPHSGTRICSHSPTEPTPTCHHPPPPPPSLRGPPLRPDPPTTRLDREQHGHLHPPPAPWRCTVHCRWNLWAGFLKGKIPRAIRPRDSWLRMKINYAGANINSRMPSLDWRSSQGVYFVAHLPLVRVTCWQWSSLQCGRGPRSTPRCTTWWTALPLSKLKIICIQRWFNTECKWCIAFEPVSHTHINQTCTIMKLQSAVIYATP